MSCDILRVIEKSVITLVLCIGITCATGCEKSDGKITSDVSYDSSSIGGDLGTVAGCHGSLETLINSYCISVNGSSTIAENMNFNLANYYYSSSDNIVAYKIVVTGNGGNTITKAQADKLLNMYDNDQISVSFGIYNEKTICERVVDDELFCISGVTLLGDCEFHTNSTQRNLTILIDGETRYLSLPNYSVDNGMTECDVSLVKDLNKCVIGEKTVTIVYDTTEKQSLLNKELKTKESELGDFYNEEDYGYEMYNEINLKMKDGSLILLDGDDGLGKHVQESLYGVSIQNNMQTLQVLLDDEVDLSEVHSVIIDDIECAVK